MKKILLAIAACALLASCGGVDNPDNGGGGNKKEGIVEVTCSTEAAADVKENSLTLKGKVYIKTDKSASGTAWFYFGTDKSTVTTQGQKTPTSNFTSKDYTETTVNIAASLAGLTPETTFYYALAASVGGKEIVGNVMSVTTAKSATPPPTPGEETAELVDLGLSVKWRAWNLGAKKPEEFGDYYAWGEVQTKSRYQSDTYKWSDANFEKMTKYNSTDGKKKLEAADDAAAAKLGGKFRMPTAGEFKDLREKCVWTYEEKGDVAGYTVTAENGNSIFLPICGMRYEENLLHKNYGLYWSSSLDADESHGVALSIMNGEVKEYDIQRFVGFSIRPVSD